MAALSHGRDVLDDDARALPALLAGRAWAADVYLAGSAALALHLGHRQVRDLDLMTSTNRLRPADRRDLLQDLLATEVGFEVETARDGFLHLRAASGAALRFYYYPYPLVDPLLELDGLPVASLVDLGLMKLGAVISRGARRDFVDLYLLARELPLESLLERAAGKFGHVRDFPLQALKGLADLTLVHGEPMPELQEPLAWSEVESWLTASVRRIGRARLDLAPAPAVATREEADPR